MGHNPFLVWERSHSALILGQEEDFLSPFRLLQDNETRGGAPPVTDVLHIPRTVRFPPRDNSDFKTLNLYLSMARKRTGSTDSSVLLFVHAQADRGKSQSSTPSLVNSLMSSPQGAFWVLWVNLVVLGPLATLARLPLTPGLI